MAPQFGHLRCLIAKQQRMPIGKKSKAQKTPKHVKSSSKIPTRHAGHPPTTTTCGGGGIGTVLCMCWDGIPG